jgi:hypothetical protein
VQRRRLTLDSKVDLGVDVRAVSCDKYYLFCNKLARYGRALDVGSIESRMPVMLFFLLLLLLAVVLLQRIFLQRGFDYTREN